MKDLFFDKGFKDVDVRSHLFSKEALRQEIHAGTIPQKRRKVAFIATIEEKGKKSPLCEQELADKIGYILKDWKTVPGSLFSPNLFSDTFSSQYYFELYHPRGKDLTEEEHKVFFEIFVLPLQPSKEEGVYYKQNILDDSKEQTKNFSKILQKNLFPEIPCQVSMRMKEVIGERIIFYIETRRSISKKEKTHIPYFLATKKLGKIEKLFQ